VGGEVLRGEAPDEARGSVDDDVEITIGHRGDVT
jgi:hypothetical protein